VCFAAVGGFRVPVEKKNRKGKQTKEKVLKRAASSGVVAGAWSASETETRKTFFRQKKRRFKRL